MTLLCTARALSPTAHLWICNQDSAGLGTPVVLMRVQSLSRRGVGHVVLTMLVHAEVRVRGVTGLAVSNSAFADFDRVVAGAAIAPSRCSAAPSGRER